MKYHRRNATRQGITILTNIKHLKEFGETSTLNYKPQEKNIDINSYPMHVTSEISKPQISTVQYQYLKVK